jgi:hypothetical protein
VQEIVSKYSKTAPINVLLFFSDELEWGGLAKQGKRVTTLLEYRERAAPEIARPNDTIFRKMECTDYTGKRHVLTKQENRQEAGGRRRGLEPKTNFPILVLRGAVLFACR